MSCAIFTLAAVPLTLILAFSAAHAAFGDSIVATLMVGTHVPTPGFNPANGDIYVSNYDLGTVSVFAGDSNTLLGTIPVGAYPLTPIFNPTNQNMYVSNYGNESVSVIFGNKLSANVHVDNNPLTPAIDPNNGQVYISDYGDASVSVVSLSGVDEPCALMYPTSPGSECASPSANCIARAAWRPSGRGAVMW